MSELRKKYCRVIPSLWEIDFIPRYQELSARFRPDEGEEWDCHEPTDKKEVLAVFKDLGWDAKYWTRERFYRSRTVEVGEYTFYCNVVLRYGIVELIWAVFKGEECIIGGPLPFFSVYMLDDEPDEDTFMYPYVIRDPLMRSYEDLREILRVNFEMFEDFIEVFLRREAAGSNTEDDIKVLTRLYAEEIEEIKRLKQQLPKW